MRASRRLDEGLLVRYQQSQAEDGLQVHHHAHQGGPAAVPARSVHPQLIGPIRRREDDMEGKTLGAVILVAFAACACSKTETAGGGMGDCNSGVCKLDVKVAAAGCADAANISVSPDPVRVPKNQPNQIEWTIATDGYSWVA